MILRLIELRRLKEVIPRLRQLITSYAGSNHYSVAYCVIIGYHIMGELSELHRTYLTKIFFYGFNDV